MKVLITGFEPNDDGLNASQLLVKSLRDRPPQKLTNTILYQNSPAFSKQLIKIPIIFPKLSI